MRCGDRKRTAELRFRKLRRVAHNDRYTDSVKRAGIVVVLLAALLWQALALARPGAMANPFADIGHAALHWGEEGHHHHDDGSYHVDDSDESTRHLLADHVNGTVLTFDTAMAQPHLQADSPAERAARAGPHPFLDGLLRPPRLNA